MGFLTDIKRAIQGRAEIKQLPVGSITVDREGVIITTTVASAYPKAVLAEIGREVLALFREARESQTPLTEISLHFGSLLITARELRGGAIIFLLPQATLAQMPN
jgi:hypothetical protein